MTFGTASLYVVDATGEKRPSGGPLRPTLCDGWDNDFMRPPMRVPLLLALALLLTGASIYGASILNNVVIGGGGLDGACEITPDDQEGSVLRSRSGYWPPRTDCVVTNRLGEVVRVETHEWPWVSIVVIALGALAVGVLIVGVARMRFA